MTIDLTKLEETIADSFIRSNVLAVPSAIEHASLAVMHVKNALRQSAAVARQETDDDKPHWLYAHLFGPNGEVL